MSAAPTEAGETARAFDRHARYINPAWIKVLDLLGYGRVFTRALGSRMWDAEGRAYVDFLAGCGSVPLGYNHPELVRAAEESLRACLPSFVQLAPPREAGLLAEALAARLPPQLSRAHFVSSGSEAVDGALKLALAATRRPGVLHCERSYHGVSLGALSVMGSARMRAPFPVVPDREHVPFGDLGAAETKLKTGRFAAFIVEPIQFEGGVRLTDPSYFVELHALCRRHGTLLVFDEAQTGLGRTGTLFAFEWLGMVPDVLCYAKALSGGLVPIGGYSTSPELQRRAYGGMQDCELVANTFGGGALACVVARKTLELIDDALLARVRATGEHLGGRLTALAREHAMVKDARGKGLLWAIECGSPTAGALTVLTLGLPNLVARELYAFWVAQRMLERGFLTQVPAHDQNVLRIEPVLVVEREEVDAFVDALHETLLENEGFFTFVRSAGGRLLSRQLGLHDDSRDEP
ncbi:MAG: aspartate aminotransferase family protein [Labilithrix sp.]